MSIRKNNFLNCLYQKNSDIVFRKIADETILVPICHKANELSKIYRLNETAAYIWELIDGKKSMNQIKTQVAAEFKISPKRTEQDLSELIEKLLQVGMIGKVTSKNS
ncbi:MAG: PqqD family protein [Planctomycetes bacterium]|nr:PqqD family protein [Planctomycetota bacterium]